MHHVGPLGRLHAERFGRPTDPLVLGVHGLTGSARAFDLLGPRLAAAGLQLVALDLRGRGRSETTPPGTYGWANHARDLFAVADALGAERFAIVGQSMGGSVAMKAASLDSSRLSALVLADIAGRVDPGVGPVIASVAHGLDVVYDSPDAYVQAMKDQGLVRPWTPYWDRYSRDQLVAVPGGGFRHRADPTAVAEDRAYTATQDPYDRWRHLTMPTLLLRATHELAPGAGHVVPPDDRDRFLAEVPTAILAEIPANHLTVLTHPAAIAATATFLTTAARRGRAARP